MAIRETVGLEMWGGADRPSVPGSDQFLAQCEPRGGGDGDAGRRDRVCFRDFQNYCQISCVRCRRVCFHALALMTAMTINGDVHPPRDLTIEIRFRWCTRLVGRCDY